MLQKIMRVVFYLFVLYSFVGFVLLPLFVKPKLIESVELQSDAKLAIENLSFNPFTFNLKLSNLELSSKDGSPLIYVKSYSVNLELTSLLFGAIHVKKIELQEPKVSLVYNKMRELNIVGIFKASPQKEERESDTISMPHIIIDSMDIVDGRVLYKDLTREEPFEFSFDKIGFSLQDIDTDEINTSEAEVRFYTTLGDGGFIDLKTKVLGFEPVTLKGSLNFEASKLYTQWKYLKEDLNLEVADGKISLNAEYELNLSELNSTKISNLNVALTRLRVRPKDESKDILNLDSMELSNATIFPLQENANIEKVALKGLSVKAKRDEKGLLDWLEYIKVKSNDTNETQVSSDSKWSLVVEDVALEKIYLEFEDSAVTPIVKTTVDELNFYANDITLLGEKPLNYRVNMLLNTTTKCRAEGSLKYAKLDFKIMSSCSAFDIVHYEPYIEQLAKKSLQKYDLKVQNALAGFSLEGRVQKLNDETIIKVSDANITLDEVQLDKKSTKEHLTGFRELSIDRVTLDTHKKSIDIEKVSLDTPSVRATRYKSGHINFENIVLPKKSQKSNISKKEEPFSIKLKEFALNRGALRFRDKMLKKPTDSSLDRINFNAYNIDLAKNSWLSYKLFMRINKKGRLQAKGDLRHTPLKQKGVYELKNISLEEINPYLQENYFVRIDDGRFSLKGKTLYSPSKLSPDLRVQGSFGLNSLFVNDSRDDSLLLSLNEVGTKEFTLELFPSRFYVNEVDVNSFYVNARVDENQSMNFSQLVKKSESPLKEAGNDSKKSEKESPSFPISILKVNVSSGSAKFADYSIPIKFNTQIHHLDGVIYSISNRPGETTYVNMHGEVDKYGSMMLKGSVDSSNPKAYTDLLLNFKNLELSAMSGYSASFAGHEIDSGKLYLDLGYEILNSQLKASNSIVMKKVVLGAEVEDENITVLPLGFVLGLLEDSEGVVDIEMPVEGNVDEPDFKYGRLILTTIGNLITKAVVSPFKFLGSVMGIDGEELEFIAFDASSSTISPPQREKLDSIAKMMLKKPKISLKVGGVYDKRLDTQGIQRDKLIDLVVQRSGIKNIQENESAMRVDILENIYEEMRDDSELEKIRERLSQNYKDEEFDRAYQNELINLCISIQSVSIQELERLAKDRAEKIVNYLVQEKMISPQRIEQKENKIIEYSGDEFVKVAMEIEVK